MMVIMKALISIKKGGPQTLIFKEFDLPHVGKSEVLIRVKAAGVNFPDTLIIQDLYQNKPMRPFAPGSEVAGLIVAVGDDVNDLSIGDRVIALIGFGGFATHISAKVSQVTKIPDSMPFEDAACFLFTYGTSYYALHARANLQQGETLLISGAAGGVGAAAIELAKISGARVIAAVSSKEKAKFCKELGADDTIIYPRILDRNSQKILSATIKNVVGSNGVDVVYDAVGGTYAEPLLRAMAWNGRFLVVGFPAGISKIPLNLALLKSCQIVGVFWGSFTQRYPEEHQTYISELFKLYQKGYVKPRINKSFTFDQAPAALTYISQRKALGKVVIVFD